MKQESTAKYILRLTLTLLIICAVVAGILAAVNAVTAPIIAAAKEAKIQEAVSKVLPGGGEETDFIDATGIVTTAYLGENGYAVQVEPAGFGGAITMMVGVDFDGKVLGISIISHAETPGLGAIASAGTDKGNAFRDQFVGLVSGIIIGDGENQIDALSGATVTSQAVVDGVNAALACRVSNDPRLK